MLFIGAFVAASTVLTSAVSGDGQEPGGGRKASELFASAPARVMPLLPVNARLDMIDYFEFGSEKTTNNALGGKARIKAMSDREVRYETASGATGQLVVVPVSANDSILVLVQTYSVPQPDSSIEFFTTDWEPAKVGFSEPVIEDWLTAEGRADIAETEAFVPFVLWQAEVEPDGSRIILTNSMESYYAPVDSVKLAQLLHKQLVYMRNGKKYVRDKNVESNSKK